MEIPTQPSSYRHSELIRQASEILSDFEPRLVEKGSWPQVMAQLVIALSAGESRPGAWEYRARSIEGHVDSGPRLTPEDASDAYEEAWDREFFGKPTPPVIEQRRPAGSWRNFASSTK